MRLEEVTRLTSSPSVLKIPRSEQTVWKSPEVYVFLWTTRPSTWARFASEGYLGSFPPVLYLAINPVETATHLCGVVDGGPLSTGQIIEGVVGAVGESGFWAEATEAVVEARTKRSNHRIIPRVYSPSLRTLAPGGLWSIRTLTPCSDPDGKVWCTKNGVLSNLLASVSTGCREIIERRLLGAVENQFWIAYRTKYIFLMPSSPV